MKREKELAKNTVIIAIGKICTQFISFLLLPVYTALLSTEDYGVVDLLNTYVSLLLPIVILQVDQGTFRFLIDVRNDENKKKEIISTTLFGVFIQSVIYLALFRLFAGFIHNNYKYFLASNVVACIFSVTMLQIARGLGNNTLYALGSFLTASVMLFLNIVFVVIIRLGATGMLLSNFVANIICTIFLFVVLKIYKYFRIKEVKFDIFKKLIRYSVPLVPNSISWWIFNASDRTVVSYILGVGINGIYSAANKFSGIYITFYNIFNMTWTESASMHINDEDSVDFFTNTVDLMFRLFSALCFGIIATMPFVFPIMVNKKFDAAYYQIPILMLAALFNVVVGLYSVIYIAKKMTREVAKTSIISAIINIIVNIALIKIIGLYAASISTAIAYGILMIYRYIDVKKYVDVRINKRLMLSTFIMIIFIFFTYYTRNKLINSVALLITIIYSVLINYSLLIQIISEAKMKLLKR